MAGTKEAKLGKFAFLGPASVGKSTLTDIYKERFEGNAKVLVLEEGAQLFFHELTDADRMRMHTTEMQANIQKFVLEREQRAFHGDLELMICDRSVLDPVVYAAYYQGKESASILLDNIQHWLPTYTSFFLLDPQGIPNDPGPFRREKPEDRLALFDSFREILSKYNLPHLVIRGSLAERIAAVDAHIYESTGSILIFNHGAKGEPSLPVTG